MTVSGLLEAFVFVVRRLNLESLGHEMTYFASGSPANTLTFTLDRFGAAGCGVYEPGEVRTPEILFCRNLLMNIRV